MEPIKKCRVQNENPKYIEGDIVLMKIVKTTTFPDEEQYYVMQDPREIRYLIKQKYYSHYNLDIGKEIKCRVDKINCTGKIFFEPEHPFYEIGETYEFKVIEKAQIANEAGLKVDVLVVNDTFENKLLVPVDKENTSKPDDLIICRVDKITKGKLYLTKEDSVVKRLKKGEVYKFEIISTDKASDGKEYFKLKGQNESIHKLPKEYYQTFNFKKGMTIKCKVEKYISDIDYLLEPIHPFYKISKVYDFEFLEKRIEKNHLGEKREVLIVNDIFNNEGRVFIKDSIRTKKPEKGEKIKCKVLKFMKGSVVLDMV